MYTYVDVAVVFGKYSTFYPPWVTLSLWDISLWSNGLPIWPPISTWLNAADIHAYPRATAIQVPWSMAEWLNIINDWVQMASILVPHADDL
jgi:hypothetical protein